VKRPYELAKVTDRNENIGGKMIVSCEFLLDLYILHNVANNLQYNERLK